MPIIRDGRELAADRRAGVTPGAAPYTRRLVVRPPVSLAGFFTRRSMGADSEFGLEPSDFRVQGSGLGG